MFFIHLLFFTASAHATLGEPVQTVEIDREVLNAAKKTATRSDRYTVHEMESGTGTVREYANSAGIVFGIAWSGTASPDLDSLLGTYAKDYSHAAASKVRQFGKRSTEVRGKTVTVQKWGHMRNLGGRAYDPALLPTGVSVEDIQ